LRGQGFQEGGASRSLCGVSCRCRACRRRGLRVHQGLGSVTAQPPMVHLWSSFFLKVPVTTVRASPHCSSVVAFLLSRAQGRACPKQRSTERHRPAAAIAMSAHRGRPRVGGSAAVDASRPAKRRRRAGTWGRAPTDRHCRLPTRRCPPTPG